MSMRSLLLAAIPALLAAWPSTARPCSPAPCWLGDHFVPEGVVPVNVPGFLWTPRHNGAGAVIPDGSVQLFDARGATLAVTLEETAFWPAVMIVPARPLLPNASYELMLPSTCAEFHEETLHYAVSTSPEAPLPARLGELEVVQLLRGTVEVAAGASCTDRIDAVQAELRVELSDEAKLWEHALLYETFVDGQPWAPRRSATHNLAAGSSWRGRGVDLLYTVCNANNVTPAIRLEPGKHQVTMQARIAGRDDVLTTPPLEVELSCGDGAETGEDGAGCSCAAQGSRGSILSSLLVLAGLFSRRLLLFLGLR
jgi:hypothetical protein